MQHGSAVSHHSGHAGKRRVLVLEPRTGITWNHSLVLSLHCWTSKQHWMGISRHLSAPPSHTKTSVQRPYTKVPWNMREEALTQLWKPSQRAASIKTSKDLPCTFLNILWKSPLSLLEVWSQTQDECGVLSPLVLQFNLNPVFSIHPPVYNDNISVSTG